MSIIQFKEYIGCFVFIKGVNANVTDSCLADGKKQIETSWTQKKEKRGSSTVIPHVWKT